MQFNTKVNGIPCKCKVLMYEPPIPTRIYSPDPPDFDMPEPAEFDYVLLDRKGYRANWLDKYNSEEVANRLLEEFQFDMKSEYYTP